MVATSNVTTTTEIIGDGNENGTALGGAGEKIGFFGATPSEQVVVADAASSSTADLKTTLDALTTELRAKGLIG